MTFWNRKPDEPDHWNKKPETPKDDVKKNKLTKNMFSCWDGNEYDNELIITHSPKIRSVELADYILQCQVKADNYDMLMKIAREERER